MVGAVRAFTAADDASDHLPIALTIATASKDTTRRRRTHAIVASSATLRATLQYKLEMLDLVGSARHLDASVTAARGQGH